MKIFVVSSYFGPETSVGVLRVNAFVRHWADSGHHVVVLTMPFAAALPAGLRGRSNVEVHQIEPWLLGSRQSGGAQGYSKGAKGGARKLLKFQYWLKKNILCNYLDPRVLWWPRVVAYARRLVKASGEPDVIFSTVPSYTAHSAAALIKRRCRKAKWVADYRDLWFGNPIFPGCGPVRMIERAHERLVLANADLVVSINSSLVEELARLHAPRRFATVPNGFEDSELELAREGGGGTRRYAGVNIVYAGSILPGLQDPTPLLQAICELADAERIAPGDLSLCFYGDYAALDDFPLARDPRVTPFLRLCGKEPREEMLRIQRGADFLLFLGSQPVAAGVGSTRGVVSGKVFEYLISGTEILAVGVTEDMLVADMIGRARAGAIYARDVRRIKERLLAAVQDGVPKTTPDFAYLDQFRRSVQARRLISEVEAL